MNTAQALWSRWFGSAAAANEALPVRLGRRASYGAAPSSSQNQTLDHALLAVVLLLVVWGTVMVYSATIAMPDNPRFAHYAHNYFLVRHLAAIAVAVTAAMIAFQVPLQSWERIAPLLFVACLVLLLAVLLPFVGKGVNGAKRWINLGVTTFQPSELAKFSTVLYAAGYMVRKIELKEDFIRAVWPMAAAVAIMGTLLLAEPDMGAFMVIAVIAMGILFLGGVNARMFFLISGVLVAAFALMIAFNDYRRARIFAYLDPWSEHNALGKGYQLTHSLIAIGRGEIFGVGLGGSVEKLHWLPEAHTDFLLAVIGEEFGLVGVLLLLGLFLWLARRVMHIGRQAVALDRVFAGLVAQGVGIWLGFQAFINMGVNLGALPTKGLTLPLMSYGGSAILVNLVALAVVLRVDFENRQLMQGGRA
ncbi:MAG: putative lipid II flippase FtsW [Rhodoferax sp.]|nr:putative lipid II flippase FtsW [Rhodoferax sp.]